MGTSRPPIPASALDIQQYQDTNIPRWLLPQLRSVSLGANGLLASTVEGMANGEAHGAIAVAFKKGTKTVLAWCLRLDPVSDQAPLAISSGRYRYMLYTRNSYRRQGLGTKVYQQLASPSESDPAVFTKSPTAAGFWNAVRRRGPKLG